MVLNIVQVGESVLRQDARKLTAEEVRGERVQGRPCRAEEKAVADPIPRRSQGVEARRPSRDHPQVTRETGAVGSADAVVGLTFRCGAESLAHSRPFEKKEVGDRGQASPGQAGLSLFSNGNTELPA